MSDHVVVKRSTLEHAQGLILGRRGDQRYLVASEIRDILSAPSPEMVPMSAALSLKNALQALAEVITETRGPDARQAMRQATEAIQSFNAKFKV